MQINCYSKKHDNLNNSELKKIIQLKKQEWKYNSTSHKNWIKVHLKKNDIQVDEDIRGSDNVYFKKLHTHPKTGVVSLIVNIGYGVNKQV